MIRELIEPYNGRISKLPMALARYVVNPEYRVMTKVRHIISTNGRFSKYLSYRLRSKYPIIVSSSAIVGKNLSIPHYIGVVIGDGVRIGDNCIIYQGVTLGQNKGKYPTLGDNVTVCTGAIIIGDVSIGNNVVIGANSVVTKNIPSNTVVAGVPAVIIKHI